MRSQETITSQSSVSVSQSQFSPAEVKKLNNGFLKAVEDLDTLLIHKWVKDLSGRPILNTEHVQSALLALASMREPKKARFKREAEDFRVLAVNVILDHGVTNLECTDDVNEMTPLILAACREAIVKLLIEKGASLQAKDGKLRRTALSWAARNNFPTTAQMLFSALVESQDQQTVQSRDIDGRTALDLARQKGYGRIVEILTPKQQA
jgi:ankyrin repeat protein